MKSILPLFVFIDACGWEIIKDDPFARSLAPNRRRWLSRLVKAKLNFRGYFDLYNIPFRHISLFDFSEKKSPLKPQGMNQGENVFDFLEHQQIHYHVSNPLRSEKENMEALLTD